MSDLISKCTSTDLNKSCLYMENCVTFGKRASHAHLKLCDQSTKYVSDKLENL